MQQLMKGEVPEEMLAKPAEVMQERLRITMSDRYTARLQRRMNSNRRVAVKQKG